MSTLAVRPHNSTSGGVKNVECRIAQPPKEGRGLDLEQEEKVIRIADELDKAPRHNHRGQDPVLLSLHNVGRDDVSEQDAREELHDSAEDVGSNEAERSVENLLPYGEETGMQTGAPRFARVPPCQRVSGQPSGSRRWRATGSNRRRPSGSGSQ